MSASSAWPRPAKARRLAFGLLACCHWTFSLAAPPDLTGVWMPETKRTQGFPRNPPFTAAVRDSIAESRLTYDEHLDDLGRSCLPYGMPQQALGTAAYPLEIIQTGERITMVHELHMAIRRIFLDGRSIPADARPTRLGYSVGRWEGDTLVVETAALSPQQFGGQRRSVSMRLVERYTLLVGPQEPTGKSLRLTIRIEDPEIYTQPITLDKYYTWGTPRFEMGEYFCTEDLWNQLATGNKSRIPWR